MQSCKGALLLERLTNTTGWYRCGVVSQGLWQQCLGSASLPHAEEHQQPQAGQQQHVALGCTPFGLPECLITAQQQSQPRVPIQHHDHSQQQALQPWQHQQWGSHSHQWQLHRHYRPPAAARGHKAPTPESDSESEGHRHSRGSELRLKRRQEQQEELPANVQKHWRQQWQQQQQVQQQRYRTPQGSSRGSPQGRHGSSNSAEGSASRVHSHNQGRDLGSRSRGVGPGLPSRSSSAASGIDVIGITDSITAAKSLQALQKLLQQHREHLQQIHVCAAYKAVVKLSLGLRERTEQPQASSSGSSSSSSTGSSRDQQPADGSAALDILRQLSTRMQQQIRVARPWDLAQAAWACSKLQYRDHRLLEAIAQQAQRKAAILTPQDISQLASAYARLSYQHPELLQLLQGQATAKAADFQPWVLVHTAWALHTCGQDVSQLLNVAVPLLRDAQQLQKLQALDMSSLLWLLAGHALYDEELLQAAAVPLATNIHSYSPASVANALMACAALGFTTPSLSVAAAHTVLSGIQEQRFKPRQVALSVFALAKLHACDQQLLDATAAAFERESQGYSPPLLSMLAWVCVLSKQRLPEGFVQQVVRRSRQQLSGFSADQLASLLRGLLAMTAQQDTNTLLLLSEAHILLPEKLPGISTNVLTELIKSLGKQLRRVQQQQQQHDGAQPADSPQQHISHDAASAEGNTTSSSSVSRDRQQQQSGGQQEALLGMLRNCVAEWSKPARVAQLTHWQAVSVEGLLQECGQESLAAVAAQVSASLRDEAARHRDEVSAAAGSNDAPGPARPTTAPASGTWVDSFVASTE